MIFLNKKLLPTLAAAFLLPLSVQNAQATSDFGSNSSFDVTITGLSNTTNANTEDLSNLSYAWAPFADDYTEEIHSGDSTFTPAYTNTAGSLSIGSTFSQGHSASGLVNDDLGGTAYAYYESSSFLEFENTSITDTYQIDLTVSYILSSSANSDLAFSRDLADSDVYLDFEDINFNYIDGNSSAASAASPTGLELAQNTFTYSIFLTAGSVDGLYALSSISGTLQSEIATSPVPVPAAIWFFGSALLSLTGIRKLKKTA